MGSDRENKKEIGMIHQLHTNWNRKYTVILAVILLALVSLFAMLMRPKYITIAPSEYVKVSTKGLNGTGTAKFSLDAARLQKEIVQEQDLKPAQENELESLLIQAEQYFTLSKDTELANGDTVAIQCRMPSDYLKEYRVKIENSDAKYTVAGLTDVQNVKLEDYFTFAFSGYEQHGYASWALNKDQLYHDISEMVRKVDDSAGTETYLANELYGNLFYQDVLETQFSQEEGLSNGDLVTFTCKVSDAGTGLEKYGVILEEVLCELEVENLDTLETIDLAPYVQVEFKGYDGDGTASFSWKKEQLIKDLKQRFPDGRSGYAAEDMDKLADIIESYLKRRMEKSVEPSESLHIGDEVRVQITGQEENYVSDAGFVLKNADITTQVNGLTAVDTLKLADYLKAKFTGYEETGEAEAFLDLEKLAETLTAQYANGRGDYDVDTVKQIVQNEIRWKFQVGIDQSTGLCNGDQVEISVLPDSEEGEMNAEPLYIRELGIFIEGAKKNVTVEGLKAQTEVDLMDVIQVEFSGITPDVRVSVTVDQESPLEDYIYSNSLGEIPDRMKAYNGDWLDITLEYDNEAALRDGYKIINAEGRYEITGLDTYDFDLKDTKDKRLEQQITDHKTQNMSLLQREEMAMMELLGADGAQILWNRVTLELERIVKLYAEEDLYNHNRMAVVYQALVPLMRPDESVTIREVYVVNVLENVSESKTEISWEAERVNYFYDSKEAMTEFLATLKTDIWGETEIEETIAVNELSEEDSEHEKKTENQKAENQKTEDQKTEEPEPESDAVLDPEPVKIPEISAEAKDRAVAFVEADGHRYYLFDEAVTWKEAKELCEQEKGTLATVTSWPEQAVLATLIQQGERNHYWIGATDETMEGEWLWVTDEAFSYTKWDSSQPDNAGEGEDFAVISRSFGNNWNDYPNEQEETGYILELCAAQTETEEESIYLVESETLRHESGTAYDAFCEDTYGNGHYGAVLFNASDNAWTQYELNGAYTSLTGELSVFCEAESEASFDFAVFGDGQLLWSRCGISRQSNPETFAVDISGVCSLTIQTRNLGDKNNGWLILDSAKIHCGQIMEDALEDSKKTEAAKKSDGTENTGKATKPDGTENTGKATKPDGAENTGKVIKSDEAENTGKAKKPDSSVSKDIAGQSGEQKDTAVVRRLAEQHEIQSNGVTRVDGLCRDTSGQLHEQHMEWDANQKAGIAWNLNGQYSVFSGNIVTFNNTGADVSMAVRIYGDDQLLWETEGINRLSGEIPFEVQVKDVKVLCIKTENEGEAANAYVSVTEDALKYVNPGDAREKQSADHAPEEQSADHASEEQSADHAPEEQSADHTSEGQSADHVSEEQSTGNAWKEKDSISEETITASVLPEIPANVTVLASTVVKYDRGAYYLIETPTTWKNANQFCKQMGGHLAVIDSPLDQARICSLLEHAAANDYWIGATDEAAEGEWLWITGEPMLYANWADGQPDNYNSDNGGENYLQVYRNGTWNDSGKDTTIGFIIQFEAEDMEVKEEELAFLEITDSAWKGAEYESFLKMKDIYGREHLSGYCMNASSDGWFTCTLGGAYESVRGSVIPAEGTDQNAKMNLAVFGDGILLYAKNNIEGWAQGIPFTVDVTGVEMLTIRTSNAGSGGKLLLNEMKLTQAKEPTVTERTVSLADLQLVDASNAERHERLFRDSYGNNYDGDFCFKASEDGYAVWLLDGAYTEFSGVFAASGSTGSDSSITVKIYADDELVFEQEGITRMSEPLPFTVDVAGVKNLKIVTDDAEGMNEGYVYLAEDAVE